MMMQLRSPTGLAQTAARQRAAPAHLVAPSSSLRQAAAQQPQALHASCPALSRRASLASLAWAPAMQQLPTFVPSASASAAGSVAPSSRDLLVVGPGVLGSVLGKLWLDSFPGAKVVGLTNTTNNHAK